MVRGLTLIELLLVLVIFSLVAGLSFPDVARTYKNLTVSQKVKDVVYLMRHASHRAVVEGCLIKMLWKDGKIVLLKASSSQERDEPSFTALSGVMGRAVLIPDDIAPERPPEEMYFYPDGNIDRLSFTFLAGNKKYVVSTQEARGHVFTFEETR